ncbi:MAG: 4Fe-4S binding protein [Tepidisphaeraceae bacterium]
MQTSRRVMQAASLGGLLVGVFVLKGNAEQWCPFGGVEAIYTYAREGSLICSLGISSLYVLAALLISLLIVRRAFCSHLCPIGTISEWLHLAGRKLRLPQFRVRGKADAALGLLKYATVGIILFLTCARLSWSSAPSIRATR